MKNNKNTKMKLIQILDEPVSGYWDGGAKRRFEWEIEGTGKAGRDKRGEFVRVGSWDANLWFNVAKGKTEKMTLSNIRRKLGKKTRQGIGITYSYSE
jgi:hypothetical protein